MCSFPRLSLPLPEHKSGENFAQEPDKSGRLPVLSVPFSFPEGHAIALLKTWVSVGIWSHVLPSRTRPFLFLMTPPHCLKKNGTFADKHWSRISLTQFSPRFTWKIFGKHWPCQAS